MKVFRVFLVLVVLPIGLWALISHLTSDHSTPEEVAVRVRAEFEKGATDSRILLRDLSRALKDPRAAGNEELHSEALLLRAEIYESIGSMPAAREDLEKVITIYRPGDVELELRAAQLQAADGQTSEALARARKLARKKTGPEVWRVIGELEEGRARVEQGEADLIAESMVIPEDLPYVKSIIEELCAKDPLDPGRNTLAADLRAEFPVFESDRTKEVLDACARASQHQKEARRALTQSLAGAANPATAKSLISLYRAAGRPELASDLAEAVRLDEDMAKDPEVFEATLRSLQELGRLDEAASLIRAWAWRDNIPHRELCELALAILVEGGHREVLSSPVAALRSTQLSGVKPIADFYQALFFSSRAGVTDSTRTLRLARDRWDDYLRNPAENEPIPGGHALAHIERAKILRALGQPTQERQDLLRALTPPLGFPENLWFRYVTSEEYVRLAELSRSSTNAGYRGIEERWTQAMSLAPQEWETLMETWAEVGELSLLRDAGYSFEEVYQSAVNTGGIRPAADVGPYTLYLVALEHLAQENDEGARGVARYLVGKYPGLVPAWDVLIEAQLRRGSSAQVVIDLLDRLALTGPDDKTYEFLDRVGIEIMNPAQRLEWMRLDPTGVGRRLLAQYALARGDAEEALGALGLPEPEDHPSKKLVRAEALIELDRHEEAFKVASRLLESLPAEDVEHRDVALRLALAAGPSAPGPKFEQAIELAKLRLEQPNPPRVAWLELIGDYLDQGLQSEAAALLGALDARMETRSGALLEEMCRMSLLAGDQAGAEEVLERAEAFFSDGRIELRQLVLAIEQHAWRELPSRAIAARETIGSEIDPWLEAALLVLEDRVVSGAEKAREGFAANPRSMKWMVLAAVAAQLEGTQLESYGAFEPRVKNNLDLPLGLHERSDMDPRELLGMFVAVEAADWAPLAETLLDSWQGRGSGTLMPSWVAARALERQGRTAEALEAYKALALEYPLTAAGWDRWLGNLLLLEETAWSTERIALHAARSEHRVRGLSDDELVIDKACAALAAEEGTAARTVLTRRIASEEEDGPAPTSVRTLLAKLQLERRQYAAVIELLKPALEENLASNDPVVATLARAYAQGLTHEEEHAGYVDFDTAEQGLLALMAASSKDPLPPLVLAQIRARYERQSPAAMVELMRRSFTSLRERTVGRPLSSLRDEATGDWGGILLEADPLMVETFVLEDLAHTPGNLDLWRLLAESMAAQGRVEDAGDLYLAIVDMSGDPESHYAYAWFLLEHGAPSEEISLHLEAAAISAESTQIDPAYARFVNSLATLRSGERVRGATLINAFAILWNRRAELDRVPTVLLGRAYVSTLLSRRQVRDRKVMARVLEELKEHGELDPYLPDLADAILGFDKHLPAGEEEPESK